MASAKLLEAVAVTAELCGRTFSEAAARVFVSDLDGYPEPAVLRALTRCRREVKGVLTVNDVVSRIDDGRPGPEEAWAMLPKDERGSVVWTEEMAEAAGIAIPLMDSDMIGARMAFKEAYVKACATARDERRQVRWSPSLGMDVFGRELAISEALDKGRLSLEDAREYVQDLPLNSRVLTLTNSAMKRLA
jgi:hypothetical protein